MKNLNQEHLNRIRKREAGFTLIELLVVMIILGLLAAVVMPRVLRHVEPAKQGAAQTQIEAFSQALQEYYLDHGNYPSSSEGLLALESILQKKLPKDPWGHDYVYVYPGEHGDFDIICYGADGSPGGEDKNKDIVSWKNYKDED